MSATGPGPGHQVPQVLEFLDVDNRDSLPPADMNLLSSIMKPPTSIPLPGDGSVWKTPRNSSPEFEFGDGISAVFKSLSVATTSTASKPGQDRGHSRHVLSANTAPFVPSLQQTGPSIPIPLPSMANGQQAASIHINNFTANLNYQGGNMQPAPHPAYTGHYLAGPGHYEGQPGHYPAYGPPLVFLPQPAQVPFPAYPQPHLVAQQPPAPQQQPLEEQHQTNSYTNGAGITFGSTPVVSIRAGARNSETEDSFADNNLASAGHKFVGPAPSNMSSRPSAPVVKSPAAQNYHQPEIRSLKQPVAVVDKQPPVQVNEQLEFGKSDGNNASIVIEFDYNMDQGPPAAAPVSQSSKVTTNKAESNSFVPKVVEPKSDPITSPVPINNQEDVKEKIETSPEQPSPTVSEENNSIPVNSWASLFASKTSSQASTDTIQATKPMARIQPFTAAEVMDSFESKNLNVADLELGKFLKSYALKHISAALLPRGLLNRSNWCFVNAILQALLACPPFYNMMKNLSAIINPLKQTKSKTPMLDSIVEFVSEFSVLDTQQINKPQKKDKNRKKDDIVTGISLEPVYVYNMLLNLEDETFKVVDGRQEDAEEFLSCLLNGLSDEMSSKMKLVDEAAENVVDTEANDESETDDDWKEVGAKGKSCVTRRVADNSSVATPIQALALGMCRSCVKSESGDNSATLQPFYTLQLDIQDENIQSVGDALVQNFANEKLDGFICSKTKKEIEATRSLSLEELPPILILHLKRFVYDGKTGGVQKIMKQVEFSVDLEVPKTILSSECRASNKQRQYKLFSVVYHTGREATKGHYVTDIFHTGYSTWLHCDDSQVTPSCEQSVLSPSVTSTPYILLYRNSFSS